MKIMILLLLIFSLNLLIADAPGMAALKVILVDNNNNETTEYISITWDDRVSLGRIENLKKGMNIKEYLVENEFSSYREKTRKFYNFKNFKLKSDYICNFDWHNYSLKLTDNPSKDFNKLYFCSNKETSSLDIHEHTEIIFLERAPYVHDCSGFRKLTQKVIDKLTKQKQIELMLIQLEGTDIFLINLGKPDLAKLKMFGSYYFYYNIPSNIEIEDFSNKELEERLSDFSEKSKHNKLEKYREGLKEIGFENDVIIFKNV